MVDRPSLSWLAQTIVTWYRHNQRSMPWREQPTPYHVWISEIMLQQTRIEAVIPYYYRFLNELPTVSHLAQVDDDKLMKLWEGLGYYSRARNLKKAAEVIVRDHNGELPKEASLLKKLPGIGDYTAGAIASIAYGQPEPAVDGNVLRVLMRYLACDDDIMLAKTKTTAADQLRQVYPSGADASCFTQGLMELGEVICIPNGTPRCDLCPLREQCQAHLRQETDRFPVKSPKKERKMEQRTVFLLCCDGQYALRRRESKGLLAGMWEFPSVLGHLDEQQVREQLNAHALDILSCDPITDAKHIFSHVEWHMIGYHIVCKEKTDAYHWATADDIARDYAIPTAFRAYTKYISKN